MKSLNKEITLILLAIFLAAAKIFAQTEFPFLGEINAGEANIRSDSTASAKEVCLLKKGQQIEVCAEFFEWYKIRIPSCVPVYMSSRYAECIKYKEDLDNKNRTCLSAKVSGDRVNIRSLPDKSGAILGAADKNEIVDVQGELDGWIRISPSRDTFGWVHKKFVGRPVQPPSHINSLPQTGTVKAPEALIVEGVVNPYGMVFRRIATHKLITADGKVFLLKGNRNTLNALRGKKIKVAGKNLPSVHAKYPVLEVVSIEVFG